MNRFHLVFFLLITLSHPTLAQQHAARNPGSLQKVVIGFFDALAELDVEKARSFCMAEVRILEGGKVWNFDSLALRITTRKARSPEFTRVNRLDFIDAMIHGQMAWISYFNQATIAFGGKVTEVRWLESVVLKKKGRNCKIWLLHSTEMHRTEL